MFAALHLDKGKMPELVECGEEVGTLTAEAAQRLGLPETVRIFAGATVSYTHLTAPPG